MGYRHRIPDATQEPASLSCSEAARHPLGPHDCLDFLTDWQPHGRFARMEQLAESAILLTLPAPGWPRETQNLATEEEFKFLSVKIVRDWSQL